jgi:hypothetical protein
MNMKKLLMPFVAIILLLSLTQCENKEAKKIVGVWQLQDMTLGDVKLDGNALGGWLWEFNAAGGYLTDIAGMRQKGTYTFKDSLLTLTITTDKTPSGQVYKVMRLDETEMDLLTVDAKAKQTARFIKRKVSDVQGEKD